MITVWRRLRPDRGALSLEMVLVTPVFVAFLMLLAGVGRMVDVQSQVDGAARDAARAGSVARESGSAASFAEQSAQADLSGSSWCQGGPRISPDTSGFGPGGQVAVTVTCEVDLGDLSFIGLPGTRRITGTAVAPVDQYTFRGQEQQPGGAG